MSKPCKLKYTYHEWKEDDQLILQGVSIEGQQQTPPLKNTNFFFVSMVDDGTLNTNLTKMEYESHPEEIDCPKWWQVIRSILNK